MAKQKMKVLVVDDDPHLLRLLIYYLQLQGFEALAARDGLQAIQQVEEARPDFVLLDIVLPRLDGFSVCQRIREHSAVPIIGMAALNDEGKARLLRLGADDYLEKPFDVDELLDHIHRVLQWGRHTEACQAPQAEHLPVTTFGDITIDSGRTLVSLAGRDIFLTTIEYRLLVCLAQHAGRIVPQELLLQQVWGDHYLQENHLLQVNINRLRRKLELDPKQPRYLLTKSWTGCRVGYLLTGQG